MASKGAHFNAFWHRTLPQLMAADSNHVSLEKSQAQHSMSGIASLRRVLFGPPDLYLAIVIDNVAQSLQFAFQPLGYSPYYEFVVLVLQFMEKGALFAHLFTWLVNPRHGESSGELSSVMI